jgi:hypothetical protein
MDGFEFRLAEFERELIRARTGEGRKLRSVAFDLAALRSSRPTSARKRCSGLPTARRRRTLRAPTQVDSTTIGRLKAAAGGK